MGKKSTIWKAGSRAWYSGDPELGDKRIECQTVARVETIKGTTYLHFNGQKRVKWICGDVAFRSRAEAEVYQAGVEFSRS